MKHILISLICMLTALAAAASSTSGAHISKNIEEPGTLARAVGADTDATELIVTGIIDVRDLDFIATSMTNLENLNLSGASIAAWQGKRQLSARSTFDADELPPLSLAGCKAKIIVLPSTLKTIGDGALAGAAMESIEIPASVTTVGAGAFAGAVNLRQLTFPATVTSPGAAIFRGCPSLAVVYYNAPVVPDYAFAECPALRDVYLSRTTSMIGNSAFRGDSSLSLLSLSSEASSLTSIGDHAFHGTSITQLDLGNHSKLTSIGAWAFADCRTLERLYLPSQINSLGDAAFFNSSKLNEFSAIQPVRVGDAAFKGVSSLTLHNIGGNTAEEFGRYAFYGMASLETMHLPDNLRHIGDHAFDGCTSLTSMNAPAIAAVPTLGEDVWGDLTKSEIFLGVPDDMIPQFSSTPVWEEFRIGLAGDNGPTTDMAFPSDNPEVSTRFNGSVLIVDATDDMRQLTLYDVMGRMLHQCRPADTRASIETSAWAGPVFIVKVVTTRGHEAAVKTAR